MEDEVQDGASPSLIEAVGKVSEAFEYVERARGHLFELHQLMGHADFLLGDACEMLRAAGATDDAERIERELVGRNVLYGRWTFQIVEEFDDGYYALARSTLRQLEDEHCGGARHAHERRLKEQRRTPGVPGHEMDPWHT